MDTNRPLPTLERVREVLHYDPETGVFTWLVSTSNRAKVGDVAGCPIKKGYWQIGLDENQIKAHQLAWFYMTGTWPEHEIDHIDRNKLNNAWSNLRDGSGGVNYQNQVDPRTNNTSGFRGVSWSTSKRKWRATFASKHLGYFTTPEEASAAYWAAKEQGDT